MQTNTGKTQMFQSGIPLGGGGGLLHSIGKADKCLETRRKGSTGCTEIA